MLFGANIATINGKDITVKLMTNWQTDITAYANDPEINWADFDTPTALRPLEIRVFSDKGLINLPEHRHGRKKTLCQSSRVFRYKRETYHAHGHREL